MKVAFQVAVCGVQCTPGLVSVRVIGQQCIGRPHLALDGVLNPRCPGQYLPSVGDHLPANLDRGVVRRPKATQPGFGQFNQACKRLPCQGCLDLLLKTRFTHAKGLCPGQGIQPQVQRPQSDLGLHHPGPPGIAGRQVAPVAPVLCQVHGRAAGDRTRGKGECAQRLGHVVAQGLDQFGDQHLAGQLRSQPCGLSR